MANDTQIGIHIKSTADIQGLNSAERATEKLADETRQLGTAFEQMEQESRAAERVIDALSDEMAQVAKTTEEATDRYWEFNRGTAAASEEARKLAERTKAHGDRLQEVMRIQREMGNTPDPFQAEGIVRAYEREQYELVKRDAAQEASWQKRQAAMKEERAERDALRDATIKQSMAERELAQEAKWQKRQADMKEEREEREKIRQATIKQGVEERKAARESEQAWNRRKEMLTDFLATAAAATAAFAQQSYVAFAAFDDDVRQVATIAPEWKKDIAGLTDETKALSREWRVMPEIMAATLYAAKGLGSEDIFEDAGLASKAAVAGSADATEAIEAALMAVNSFEKGVYDTQRVFDLFFRSIDVGAFTMSDLAGGFAEVTGVAGETGTSLEDVLGALVTMTRAGDDFNSAVELTGLLLTQLATTGSAASNAFVEATGKSYAQFIAEGNSLGDAMAALQEQADKTGVSMVDMVGGNSSFYRDSQAARATVALTGHHLEVLNDVTLDLTTNTGALNEAYAVMADSSQRDIDRMTVAWENLKLTTGGYIASLGWVESGINNVATAIEYLSGGTEYDLGQMVEENKAATNSVEDLAEEAARLQAAWVAADGHEWAEAPIEERMREIALATAAGATSMEDYQDKLKAVFGDMVVIDDYGFGEGFEEASVQIGNSAIVLGTLAEAAEVVNGQLAIQNAALAESFDNHTQATTAAENYTRGMGDLNAELAMMADNSERGAAMVALTAKELGTVSKILDGDTLRMEGIGDIRLLGVNTPETAKDWLGKAGMPFGEEALRFTQEFLIDPQISFDASGTDPHGRMLASVFNGDGASLEHELVAAGLALPMPVHMVGDEELVAELQALARQAAEAGEGIFGDERVASAFLEGRLEDMEQVTAMYEQLAAADEAWAAAEAEHYSAYIGHINSTVESLEEMQAALANAAVQKALLEGNMEAVPAILDMAVNMGLMTEEQASLQEQYANSMMLIEEYSVKMGDMDMVTTDTTEAMTLLATGLFTSTEAAEAMARRLDEETVAAFYEAAQGAKTLEEAAAAAGVELGRIPRDIQVKITTDLNEFNLPDVPAGNINAGGVTAYAEGGMVTGGIEGRDSVRALLAPGEFVINANAARSVGYDTLTAMNSGQSGRNASISMGGDTYNIHAASGNDALADLIRRQGQKNRGRTAAELARAMGG